MRWCVCFVLSLVAAFVVYAPASGQSAKELGFEVPEGFEVSLYADDALATDIHSLTIDSKGRVVVASKGYIKILHDTKGTGKADKATLFADFPKSGAHGMVFDGNDLICDGDQGIRRLYDTQGVGKCDKVSPVLFATTKDGEHAANGIVRGPDGWYYLITGNDAGITKDLVNSPSSPVKKPNAGVVVRFSPDGKTREVVAHGFRNPYDLAFNHLGNLFTVDADGERIHHMPYYAPTRLFDIAQGMHHGWILPGWKGSWSRPAHWPDNVERTVEIGRGSPTGVIVYRHRAFPERYRNGVFSLCWTFGRVYFFPLTRNGSTYSSKMEVFMRTTGDVGFAPTDMAVGPDGDLFIAIGGRGTRGSVFRVHYKGTPPASAGNGDSLRAVLAADEPLSSWSRARWVPAAKKLGKDEFLKATSNAKLPLEERIRAVEILTELFGGVPIEVADKIDQTKPDPELLARVIWSISRTQDNREAIIFLVAQTSAADPRVARSVWESLAALPRGIDLLPPAFPVGKKIFDPPIHTNWSSGFNSTDRRVRAAAIRVASDHGYSSVSEKLFGNEPLAYCWVFEPRNQVMLWTNLEEYSEICVNEKKLPLRMEAVRLMHLALGDVDTDNKAEQAFVGYVARSASQVDAKLRRKVAKNVSKTFPSGDRNLDLEMARLLGMLAEDVPGQLEKVAAKWGNKISAEDDIHYLLVLARLPGKRSADVTQKTARSLNGIHVKLAAIGAKPTDQVPEILEAILERLQSLDPSLPAALVADPDFGMPGHALYANKLPLSDKQAAARKLLTSIAKLDEDQARAAWNADLIRLVAALPHEEALPILRTRFADPRLTDTLALHLARHARAEDRSRLVQALGSTQASVVSAAAEALVALTKGNKGSAVEIGKAVAALRRLETQKADAKTRLTLSRLLVSWTGWAEASPKDETASWVSWFTKTYPKEAAKLPGLASADFATWKKRLDKVSWDAGDEKRGESVYQRKNCFRCHGEGRRLGPELIGVAQRFSRDDLFTAIIDPNKDIAPAYRATAIVTNSGKVHVGVVIYESPELYLLQTTPDTTVRIPGEELQTVQPSDISFMPAGLLDDLQDADIADLYTYLKNLRKK